MELRRRVSLIAVSQQAWPECSWDFFCRRHYGGESQNSRLFVAFGVFGRHRSCGSDTFTRERGNRPKWPTWRNRRRLPVRPIQAKARLLVDRGWSGRFRAQGRLPVDFEASRPASATRIGRDRVPERLESFRAEPLARAFTLRGVSQRF